MANDEGYQEDSGQAIAAAEPGRAAVKRWAQPAYDEIWGAVFPDPPGKGRVSSALFSSAERREGVSTLLAGAALTGASLLGRSRIALLDLNVRHPRLARMLRAGHSSGLAEVLAGQATLEQVAQPIGSANLLLYACGEGGMEVVTSDGLAELIGAVRESHDYVLCDCAAVNVYPDAQILAPLFDGAVLVAEAGATRRESLAQAKKRVELGHGRVLGVILNKRRYPVPRFLYRRS